MSTMKFIGVKIVDATPMTREAFEAQEGRNVGGDKHGDCYMVTYRPINAMTFGLAIEALKMGKKVARAGWNGKGMYVRFVKNWTYTDGIDDNRRCNPLFTIKNVDESVSTWVPSINDALAEDWQVVE